MRCNPLINNAGIVVTADEDKAEVLNNFLASVFNGNLSSDLSSGWTAGWGLREESVLHCVSMTT